MVLKFLDDLKSKVTKEQFEIILKITFQDIVFNRVRLGKRTSQKQFIEICKRCYLVVVR